MKHEIILGDCIQGMNTLADGSVHCCVTSPPYFNLRDYGNDGQIGLEATPDAFVAKLVEVFREVKRVLRDDGTLWLNLGDSYTGSATGSQGNGKSMLEGGKGTQIEAGKRPNKTGFSGLKPKDLIGIPWRVAFALQADGWYLRQDIIWHKPNPMPESVTDRCTKAHEYIFLLSKSARYYFDAEAIAEEAIHAGKVVRTNGNDGMAHNADGNRTRDGFRRGVTVGETRNKRSVWTVTTKPYSGAHFATYPEDLIEPCIKSGCPEGGTVLDPFGGAGTTALVARKLNRNAILCELNPEYAAIADKRLRDELGMFY